MAADEEDAKRKIAKAARRAAVTTIEDRKEAGQPAAKPLEERARQHNHSRRQNLDSRRRPNRLSVGWLQVYLTGSPAEARRRELIQVLCP